MLLSISEIFERQTAIFENKTFSGAKISISSNISERSKLFSTFEFRQKFVDVQEKGGRLSLKSHPTKIFNFVYSNEVSGDKKITVSVGKKNFVSLDLSPLSQLNGVCANTRLRCDFLSEYFLPSALLCIKSKHMNFTCRVEKKPTDRPLVDAKLSVGTKELSVHAQLCEVLEEKKHFYSFALSRERGESETQLVFTNHATKSLLLRRIVSATPDIKCGIMFRVDGELNSLLKVALKAKINDSFIHSTVSTDGVVSTVFSRRLYDQCSFLVSCKLDHIQRNYLCGIGLEWDA
jgi:hypothetical protein